jgi:type 1 glutamine amidotransferase
MLATAILRVNYRFTEGRLRLAALYEILFPLHAAFQCLLLKGSPIRRGPGFGNGRIISASGGLGAFARPGFPTLKLSMIRCLVLPFVATLGLIAAGPSTAKPARASGQESSGTPPLRALFVTGGVYHDYDKLAPFLTSQLSKRINIKFDVITNLNALRSEHFADGYDVIVYDLCLDDADPIVLDHAFQAGRQGKPTVFIHCAVHSFRNSPKVREWENYVGLRSKFHDTFGPFATQKVVTSNPITEGFPDDWKTSGDELYQTIEVLSGTQPLLTAKSPVDGRVHIVSWFHTYGGARVFATTLGHDSETAESPAYLRLLANGLLWACDKLGDDGKPKRGYAAGK